MTIRSGPPFGGSSEAGSGSLVSRQVEAMVAAWRRGERPTAEQFLARHPELGTEAALRLIYEEVCLRQEAGLEVDPAELVGRFPQWKAELEVLLDCHRLMQPALAPAALPGGGRGPGRFPAPRRARPGCVGTDLPGLAALAGRPADGPEGHAPAARKSTSAWHGFST